MYGFVNALPTVVQTDFATAKNVTTQDALCWIFLAILGASRHKAAKGAEWGKYAGMNFLRPLRTVVGKCNSFQSH